LKTKVMPSTLRTKTFPALLLVLTFLVVFSLLFDAVGGLAFLKKIPMRESLGINPTPTGQLFDIKWYGLQEYVAQNGGVDVIVIGSSAVNTGIDPVVAAQSYFNLTGIPLRIYNFGIEGLNIVPNSVYAKILVEKYHPALILYGMLPRDYLASDNVDVNQEFLPSAWIEYKSGEWNLTGNLIDHSALLRRYLFYRNWMRSDFLETRYAINHRAGQTSASGYELENATGENLDQPPDPNSPDEQETFAKYRDFKIDLARLDCLQSILNLQQSGETRVIVLEMPLEPTFYDYMGGLPVYEEYLHEIASRVTASGVLFLPASGAVQIPANDRSDRVHLNKYGAPIFSADLGARLATLTLVDGIQLTNSSQDGH
jgi:hypothetical protein